VCERACVSVRGYEYVYKCTCVGGCLCVGVRGWVRVFGAVVVVVSVHGGVGAGRRQHSRNRGEHSGTREQRRIGPNTPSSERILGSSTQLIPDRWWWMDQTWCALRIQASVPYTNRSRVAGWSAGVQAVLGSHSCTELFPQRL
jgi:hypothetical protein